MKAKAAPVAPDIEAVPHQCHAVRREIRRGVGLGEADVQNKPVHLQARGTRKRVRVQPKPNIRHPQNGTMTLLNYYLKNLA